jgi:hypothetical protein
MITAKNTCINVIKLAIPLDNPISVPPLAETNILLIDILKGIITDTILLLTITYFIQNHLL